MNAVAAAGDLGEEAVCCRALSLSSSMDFNWGSCGPIGRALPEGVLAAAAATAAATADEANGCCASESALQFCKSNAVADRLLKKSKLILHGAMTFALLAVMLMEAMQVAL